MKIKMTLVLILMLLLVSFAFASRQAAQDGGDGAKPDRWRGLVLDQTTVEDAQKLFGKPDEDKTSQMDMSRLDKRLTNKKQDYRTLQFKKADGMKNVSLLFYGGKLVRINLHLKESISPNALKNIYGLEFTPQFDGFEAGLNRNHYEQNQGKLYAKQYPSSYYLRASSTSSLVTAFVANATFGAAMKGLAGARETDGFPGKVEYIDLISRKLENRAGADVLK